VEVEVISGEFDVTGFDAGMVTTGARPLVLATHGRSSWLRNSC